MSMRLITLCRSKNNEMQEDGGGDRGVWWWRQGCMGLIKADTKIIAKT